MAPRINALVSASLESPTHGLIELRHDWRGRSVPVFVLSSGGLRMSQLERVPTLSYGLRSGYHFPKEGVIEFVFDPAAHPDFEVATDTVHIAGEFNGWRGADDVAWSLKPVAVGGRTVFTWTGRADELLAQGRRFKFVTGRHHWFAVPREAPSIEADDAGNLNYVVDQERTGWHLFSFELERPADLSTSLTVRWAEGHAGEQVPLRPGRFFFELSSDLPLGVFPQAGRTVFRIFAPRAKSVEVAVCASLSEQQKPRRHRLRRRADADGAAGIWELTLELNLHGWFYWYHVDGPRDAFGIFDTKQRILDPYALATAGREGPGIILDRSLLGAPAGRDRFKTPAWHDLVICEAHVRDLAAHAPVDAADVERRGFAGLKKWVESEDFYLGRLGVNCVELQPLQEFDNLVPDEYHWGYMTVNYFAPAGAYATRPEAASGVRELRELVRAFHERGIAVIVDVVYNHVGEPAHLMFLDKLYYFEQDAAGNLSNWSGCGNDLRCSSAMAKRLIIDSCTHWLDFYGVDGFRFDLADLVGVAVLKDVEAALKRVKPDVVLIAEPWSFRGHAAGELRDTGWASWNDGYRNFLRDYVRGAGSRDSFEYYLKGSPWYYAKWPAQTVNYTESHDDRCWLDVITENPNHDGHLPTVNDRIRTHLMAAVLFSSIGIPMLGSGQDFLKSKHGVNNTYQRGDLNALDYQRIHRFPATHAYFADWIAFRRSETGRLLRHFSRASEGFFAFSWAEGTSAAAVVFNADLSQGPVRLLLAINPTTGDVVIPLDADLAALPWRQLADQERFLPPGRDAGARRVTPQLFVPALACGLWRA
ncbi:MAG: alpha-amylase family glycosyl hydrolase [Opitutaceae bacterium]|jgi:pullulanase/glycogen debranching enzyme|nr:alpha-amylase family glycosyl hydrolase [Opitutaceae bacterium]